MPNQNAGTCDHDFKNGMALVPIWGRLDRKKAVRGDTANMVEFVLGPVMKCAKCGHNRRIYTRKRQVIGISQVIRVFKPAKVLQAA